MSTRAVYQPRSAGRSISGADSCPQHGLAVYQQHRKQKASSLLNKHTCQSERYQPRSAKQDHIWRSPISTAISKKMHIGPVYKQQSKLKRKHFWVTQPCRPGRCINRDEHSKRTPGAAVYHHRGIAVSINSNQKLKRKHFLTTQPCRRGRYINRESCISTATKNKSGCTCGRHSLVDTALSSWR